MLAHLKQMFRRQMLAGFRKELETCAPEQRESIQQAIDYYLAELNGADDERKEQRRVVTDRRAGGQK